MKKKQALNVLISLLFVFILISCNSSSKDSHNTPKFTKNGDASKNGGKIKGRIETFNTGETNYVRALAVGGNDLWVGTSTGVMQVDILSGALLNTYTRKDGLKNEYVFTIAIDRDGTKWFGTNAGGLTRFDGKNWKTYIPLHGLADYWIYSISFEKDGTRWIGTWAGANKMVGEEFTTYSVDAGLINEWVYGVGIDKDNVKWFGTEGGITRFDGTTWKSWTNKDGLGIPNTQNLPESHNTGLGTRNRHDLSILNKYNKDTYMVNYIFCAFIDRNTDEKWFGTWGGGASKFDGVNTFTNYSKADGLAGNVVYTITQDKDGALWFGTNGGLSKFYKGTWTSFLKEDGLLDTDVFAIAVDSNNTKWLGQRGGVVKFIEDREIDTGGNPPISLQ